MDLRRVPIALALTGAMAIAGCGSTTVRHVTRTITRAASAATPSTTATTPTRDGETSAGASSQRRGRSAAPRSSAIAGRSPRSLLVAAARALRHAGGYSMRADLVQNHQRTIVNLSASSDHRYEAATTMGHTTFELIALPGSAFLRGNAAFWRMETGSSAGARARARAFAGHWLRVPATGRRSVTRSLGTLAPGTLARCLTEDHGTLTVERRRVSIGGRAAVVVRDAGDAPGATPSTIAVAATGTPYPLRYVASGRTRRGGRVDVCNNGKGAGATGTITLDQFGATAQITAPAGATSAPGATL